MKTYFSLIGAFSFLPFILSVAQPGLSHHSEIDKIHRLQKDGNGILLVYSGSFNSPQFTYDIGIHFEMDTSIGASYQVTFIKGQNVLSHLAIFYKFSNPDQSTIYNYLTHQSYVSYNTRGTGNPRVDVVGSGNIDQYSCTHLQHLNTNENYTSRDDYWMCKDLPGFQAIVKALNQLYTSAGSLMIDGTIFKWGGLVKLTHYYEDKKTGLKQSAVINLVEANAAMNFPAQDFEVPSK